MSQEGESSKKRVLPGDPKADRRSFRVKLQGSVLVLICLPNRRQMRAALHLLSVSGGMIHLDKPMDEKLEVQLIFHVERATIRAKAEMLFPMWATQGWLQPFRFTGLSEASRESLELNLKSFLAVSAGNAAAAAGAGAGSSVSSPR